MSTASPRIDIPAFRIREINPNHGPSGGPQLYGPEYSHSVGPWWFAATSPQVGGYIVFDTDDPNGTYVPAAEYVRRYSMATQLKRNMAFLLSQMQVMMGGDILQSVALACEPHLLRAVDLRIGQGIASQIGAPAMTVFPDDGSEPVIYIDGDIPYVAVAELVCHEVAHVLFPDDDHGETWQAACDMLWHDGELIARHGQEQRQ